MMPPNLALAHELHKEEAARANAFRQRTLFNFSWEFHKKKDKELGSNLSIGVILPYGRIVFVKQRDRIRANLRIKAQVKDTKERLVWQFNQEYPLDLRENFLEENKGADWKTTIPVTTWLDKGSYMVYIRLENLTGDQKIEKLLPLKI